MAAEIKPSSSCDAKDKTAAGGRYSLSLMAKLENFTDQVNDAVFVDGRDVIVTASDDKSVRVWQRRETGQFWPSVCEFVPSASTCLLYCSLTGRLYVGLHNGTVSEFQLATDFNSMKLVRDFLAHVAPVSACQPCVANGWLLSVSRDKTVQCHTLRHAAQLSAHQLTSAGLCLAYDALSRHLFVGELSGVVSMIQIDDQGCHPITTLQGHSDSVRCLVWDHKRQWLYSGSSDRSVIVWDIGGRQGCTYQLHGHHCKVVSMCLHRHTNQLISAGEDGSLVVWDMNASRQQPVEWCESDMCQLCSRPFFWNLKAIYASKQLALNRQHHCRKCGRAVCSECSDQSACVPVLGLELPVRMCRPCHSQMTSSSPSTDHHRDDDEQRSLCWRHESRHQSLIRVSVDPQRASRLLTVGARDRLVKLWEFCGLQEHENNSDIGAASSRCTR